MKLIDFEWRRCRDGYRLETKGDDFVLISKSDRLDHYRPMEIQNLFSIFAEETVASPKGMHAFCNAFGLLGGGRRDLAPLRGKQLFESVFGRHLLENHGMIRSALNLFRKGDPTDLVRYWNSADGVGLARTELHVASDGRLEMVLAPP